MDFTLKIIFTGLIAFVPVDANDNIVDPATTTPHHVWVLLVDARTAHLENDADGIAFDDHKGALRFDVGDWRPGRVLNARGLLPSGDPDTTAIVFLGKEELTIVPGLASPLSVVTGKKLRDRPCCTAVDGVCEADADLRRKCLGASPDASEQMRDFAWLISLSEILNGPGNPPAKPQLDLASPTILAKLKVESGTLETLQLSGESRVEQRRRYRVGLADRFSPDPMAHWRVIWRERAVAQKMMLTMRARDSVEFRSTAAQTLVLKPPPRCSSIPCEMTVEVMNSPEKDIVERWQSHQPASTRHFELYWKLLANNVPTPRPAPRVVIPPGGDLLCPEIRP